MLTQITKVLLLHRQVLFYVSKKATPDSSIAE